MSSPEELETRLRRAMHSEADATPVSPDALVRIRARVAPAKRRATVGWLRPVATASALAFTLVGGTLAGVKIAGGGGAEDTLAEPPPVVFNPAASSGPGAPDEEPAAKAPRATSPPEYLPGFDPQRTPLPSPDAARAAAMSAYGGDPQRTHQLPEDTGGSYVAITAPDSGVTVGRRLELSGIARIFEATVVIEVSQNGKVVKREFATATKGAPDLGTWTKVLVLEPGAYRIDAFGESMEGNGARLASDSIWVTVAAEPQGAAGGEPSAQTPGEPAPEPSGDPAPDEGPGGGTGDPTPGPGGAVADPSVVAGPDPAAPAACVPADQAGTSAC